MIDKALFQYIRSMNTQNAFERFADPNRRFRYSFISRMEPFDDPKEIHQFRTILGFDNAVANCRKIITSL